MARGWGVQHGVTARRAVVTLFGFLVLLDRLIFGREFVRRLENFRSLRSGSISSISLRPLLTDTQAAVCVFAFNCILHQG